MFGHDNQDDKKDQDQHAEPAFGAPAAHDDQGGQADNGQGGGASADNGLGGFVATPVTPGDPQTTVPSPGPGGTDDLLDIKQEALQALTPLVGQLDQTPEEQFRTTMMMIQASDNQSLVKVAYEAAQKISNEKERAQALLDIVNEINYFTQHAQAAQTPQI